MVKPVLLIDGDVLVYQVGLAAERSIDWGNDIWTLHADFNECREALVGKVEALIETLKAESVIFALSCPTAEGFRKEIDLAYKANRKNARKPIVHGALRQYLLDHHDTILRPRLEADDVLGILATQPGTEPRILVSIDKDFRGVPCEFYRINSDNPQIETVTADAAIRFHALQTLTGDAVDGYKGIPGCGPKTAEKILTDVPTAKLWPAIVKAYAEAGLSEQLALTNARLARILQNGDYNTTTGEIKLWTPPSSPASTRKRSKKPSVQSPPTSAVTSKSLKDSSSKTTS